MKLRELFEALTPGQKKYVDDELSSNKLTYNTKQWDHIFGDQDRIYLEIPPQHPNVEVYKKLIELGYKITCASFIPLNLLASSLTSILFPSSGFFMIAPRFTQLKWSQVPNTNSLAIVAIPEVDLILKGHHKGGGFFSFYPSPIFYAVGHYNTP